MGAAAAGAGAVAAGSGAAGLSLGATALSAGGGVFSALMEKRAAQYNSKVANSQANQAVEQAGLKASEIERRNRQDTATARASAAQNGFENTGSINDILNQQSRQGNLDVLAAVYDGSVTAAGLRADAKLNRQRGRAAVVSGVVGAGASALGGVSNFYARRNRAAAI